MRGGKAVQRQVLYLGELNGSELAAWRKTIAVIEEDSDSQTQLALYPESQALRKFSAIQMMDVHLPTTDGRTIQMSRYTQPNGDQKLLLSHLKLKLPAQSPPKIYATESTPAKM